MVYLDCNPHEFIIICCGRQGRPSGRRCEHAVFRLWIPYLAQGRE